MLTVGILVEPRELYAGGGRESGVQEASGAQGSGGAQGGRDSAAARSEQIPARDPRTQWRTDRDFTGAAYLTLGGGCFWCVEAVFDLVPGVIDVVSGYAGGHVANPRYEQVVGARTGHAEVVQIAFDPRETNIDALLDVFWRAHDPTTLNRQGADVGPMYRSIILYADETQRAAAEGSRDAAQAAGLYANRFVTEIVPLEVFYPAEGYHQDYFAKNPNEAYCRIVIAPKVDALLSDGVIGPASR